GSLIMGGYFNGGLLAWEIAHQLQKLGRNVECVVLLGTISLNGRGSFRAFNRILMRIRSVAPRRIGKSLRLNGMRAIWNLARRIGRVERRIRNGDLRELWAASRRFGHVLVREPNKKSDMQLRSEEWGQVYYRLMTNYVPPEIGSLAFCILCDEHRDKMEFVPDVWRHLASDV